jgi:hypothetical protein
MTMQYLLTLTYRDGEGPEEGTEAFNAEMEVWGALNTELRASGQVLAASGLMPETATTVRTRGGDLVVTDGPFAETKEILFSFYAIEAEDLDAAIAIARKMPATEYGSVTITAMTRFTTE